MISPHNDFKNKKKVMWMDIIWHVLWFEIYGRKKERCLRRDWIKITIIFRPKRKNEKKKQRVKEKETQCLTANGEKKCTM